MRLDKYISNTTDYSRSQVKRLIKKALVAVNGVIVTDPAASITASAQVCLNGAPVSPSGPRYFMLNKPVGIVSATKDREHACAIDLMNEPRPTILQIAGRLDKDASGLLLITDDGKWNHHITSPRHDCRKTYEVTVADPLQNEWIKKFFDGIWLNSEKRRCLPASLKIIEKHQALLTISEGKYHQVKRMFAALGNRVTALHRTKVGDIALDSDLPPGDYRPLSEQEINSVINHA